MSDAELDRGIEAFLGSGDPEHGPSARKFVRGIGVPGGIAILFVLLRILAVSHWNWTTATSVAGTIDLQSLVQMGLGTLFARPGLTGLVVMVVLPLVVFSIIWPTPGESRWAFAPLLFATVLGAIAVARVVSSRSWWLPIGVVVIGGGLALVYRRWSGVLRHRAVERGKRSLNLAILFVLLGLAAAVDTPWIERERIIVVGAGAATTASGTAAAPRTHAVSGYVLQVEPGFVRIMTDARSVLILRTDQIVSRRII